MTSTRLLAVACALGLAGTLALAIGASTTDAQAATTKRVLFDNTKAETAGNADWVISTSQPDPLQQNANPTSETSWTGAISAWGVALHKTGSYALNTLPSGGRITYGDSSNAQDLSKYNVFVLPEPNIALSASEKTAIMSFVKAGGGLFMISDHNASDRNNDGIDSVGVLNDLMSNNSVDSSDPFGFAIDVANISTDNPNVIGAKAAGDPIIAGPFGAVTGTIIRSGTTATLHPANNAGVRGEIFRTGFSGSGTTGAAFVTSTFGSGRVAFWGDSSPMDDGTGSAGNTLFDGWNDPAGTNAALALNATDWLAAGTATTPTSTTSSPTTSPTTPPSGGTERITNGSFENLASFWSLGSGAAISTTHASAGTHALTAGGAISTTQSATQQVTIPAGATSAPLTFKTYVTSNASTTSVFDVLNIQVNGTTVKQLSNTSPRGAFFSTTVDLKAYAGQTVTLKFQAVNDSTNPTQFWIDEVSLTA